MCILTSLEYGSRAISVITTAVGKFFFINRMKRGTMPDELNLKIENK